MIFYSKNVASCNKHNNALEKLISELDSSALTSY